MAAPGRQPLAYIPVPLLPRPQIRVDPVLGMRITGAWCPVDRLKPHQAHQTTGPAAPMRTPSRRTTQNRLDTKHATATSQVNDQDRAMT